MMRLLMVAGILVSACSTAHAFFPMGTEELKIVGVVLLPIGMIGLGFLVIHTFETMPGRAPPDPDPAPEDYDRQAEAFRGKARMLDAQAAYDDSRTRAALKRGEFQEVEKFLKDQRDKDGGDSASLQ